MKADEILKKGMSETQNIKYERNYKIITNENLICDEIIQVRSESHETFQENINRVYSGEVGIDWRITVAVSILWLLLNGFLNGISKIWPELSILVDLCLGGFILWYCWYVYPGLFRKNVTSSVFEYWNLNTQTCSDHVAFFNGFCLGIFGLILNHNIKINKRGIFCYIYPLIVISIPLLIVFSAF